MKNKKNKRLITLLLPLLLLSGVSAVASTYAWWNTLTKTQNETVQLGTGVAVTVGVDLPQDKALIPAGNLVNSDTQTEKVTLKYKVGFDGDVTKTFTLSVVASDVKIAGTVTHAALVNIVITAPGWIDNAGGIVTVEVTLGEPANQTDYEAIAGKAITFNLTFTTALA